jgi:hypothetical protein
MLKFNNILFCSIIALLLFSCEKDKKTKPKNDTDNKPQDSLEIVKLNNVSWSKIKTGPFNGENVTSTARLDGKFYVSTAAGIYTSNNGYDFVFMQKLSNTSFVGIELHQSRNELFAFSQGTDVFRLENNTWKKLTINGLETPIKNIFTNMLTNDSGHIYVFSGDNIKAAQLFKSKDMGSTWQKINLPNGIFLNFGIYKKNEILLLKSDGLMHSIDNGISWQTAASGYTNLTKLFIHPDGNQMVMYDVTPNMMIYGTLTNLTSEYCIFGNNFLLGYNNSGYLFTSDISDDNGEYIKFSYNNGKTWYNLGITPKYLTQASLLGGSVFGVMEQSLVYLEDGAVRYKLFGTPTLPIVDFIKQNNKITAVGNNTIIYISEDDGQTWTMGSVKAPFSASAKCLYIDADKTIWIGTSAGLFIVDAFASSVILNQSFNLNNYFVSSIDRERGYTLIGLSHVNLNSHFLALALDNQITKYTVYQIPGRQNLAISAAEISYFSNGIPSFKVSMYSPAFSVWYECFATMNARVIGNWESKVQDFFGGNAFLKTATNPSKKYTIMLYQKNNYEVLKDGRKPSIGKMNTVGNFSNLWIDEDDFGWALIDGYLNKSNGKLLME